MNEIELEAAIDALRTLATRLEALRHINAVEPDDAEQQRQYASILDDAYAAFGLVETKVDELGQELEFQHERLGKAIEPDEE